MFRTNPPTALSRRQFVTRVGAGTAVSAVGLLIAACQASPSTAPGSAPAATTAPAASGPKWGGTLVMAQASDPNPVPGNIDGSQGTVLSGLVFQGLIYVDKDRNIKPNLAESWEANDNQTVFTLQRPTTASTFKNILQKVETPDPATVKLTLTKEYGGERQVGAEEHVLEHRLDV